MGGYLESLSGYGGTFAARGGPERDQVQIRGSIQSVVRRMRVQERIVRLGLGRGVQDHFLRHLAGWGGPILSVARQVRKGNIQKNGNLNLGRQAVVERVRTEWRDLGEEEHHVVFIPGDSLRARKCPVVLAVV